MDEFNEKPIKEYNKGIKKYFKQHKEETMSEEELFEGMDKEYARFKFVKLTIIFYVIVSILGVLITVAEFGINIKEKAREKELELLKEELALETSFAQNIAMNMIIEDELVYKNGVTIPLANKYIDKSIKRFTVDKEVIANNISDSTKVIKTSYENKKEHDKLEIENFLTEFGKKLVEVEGYEVREVIGEEGTVYFRNEKNEFFTYIIINGYDVTYGIAKDNVEN